MSIFVWMLFTLTNAHADANKGPLLTIKGADEFEVIKGIAITKDALPKFESPRILRAQRALIRDAADFRILLDPSGAPEAKLLHPQGVCAPATWEIFADTGYTGLFAKGVSAPAIVRMSPAGNDTSPHASLGIHRSLGIAVKIFPTVNPDQAVPTFNIVAFDRHGPDGNKASHYFRDSDRFETSSQYFTNWMSPSSGEAPLPFNNLFAAQFARRWKELAHERPPAFLIPKGNLAPIGFGAGLAMGGRPVDSPVAPAFLKLRASRETMRISMNKPSATVIPADLRSEILEYQDGEIVFDVILPEGGDPAAIPAAQRVVGRLRIGQPFHSPACDYALRFHHHAQ